MTRCVDLLRIMSLRSRESERAARDFRLRECRTRGRWRRSFGLTFAIGCPEILRIAR